MGNFPINCTQFCSQFLTNKFLFSLNNVRNQFKWNSKNHWFAGNWQILQLCDDVWKDVFRTRSVHQLRSDLERTEWPIQALFYFIYKPGEFGSRAMCRSSSRAAECRVKCWCQKPRPNSSERKWKGGVPEDTSTQLTSHGELAANTTPFTSRSWLQPLKKGCVQLSSIASNKTANGISKSEIK